MVKTSNAPHRGIVLRSHRIVGAIFLFEKRDLLIFFGLFLVFFTFFLDVGTLIAEKNEKIFTKNRVK